RKGAKVPKVPRVPSPTHVWRSGCAPAEKSPAAGARHPRPRYEEAMTEGTATSGTPAGECGRLLVADDKEINREMLCRDVRHLGHQATAAENGRTALALLRGQPFDLVLLDVLMPEMDGYTALNQIKADETLRAIPVIMISGLDEVDSVVRCIAQGAEDYLHKPFDPVLLRARINACLEKKRLRDAEHRRARE